MDTHLDRAEREAKDREAFETWEKEQPFWNQQKHMVSLSAWQAASEHYAPKLTEKDAVEAATTAIDITAVCERSPEKWAHPEITNPRACAIAALHAAGVRFKEEA